MSNNDDVLPGERMMQQEKAPLRVTVTLYALAVFFPVVFYFANILLQDHEADAKVMQQVGVINGVLHSLKEAERCDGCLGAIEAADKALQYISENFVQKESNQIDVKLQNAEAAYFALLETWQPIKSAFAGKQQVGQIDVPSALNELKRLSAAVLAVSGAKKERVLYVMYAVLLVAMVMVLLLIYFVKHYVNEQNQKDAFTDRVTGLYNRDFFLNEIRMQCERIKRQNEPLSIVYFCIDDFEGYQLETRNELVRSLSELLGPLTRSSDIPCRVAENEYAIITPNTAIGNAEIMIERIRKAVAKDIMVRDIPVTISCGMVQHKDSEESTKMVERATKAMHDAKKHKNRVVKSL